LKTPLSFELLFQTRNHRLLETQLTIKIESRMVVFIYQAGEHGGIFCLSLVDYPPNQSFPEPHSAPKQPDLKTRKPMADNGEILRRMSDEMDKANDRLLPAGYVQGGGDRIG
jgi:hypothetical protein